MNADILESIVANHLPAASRGDKQAYGRIVEGCQTTITSIALAIVRDVPASEDIAQEAFISAWQQLGKLNNPSSFMPWLRQITRNLSLDYLRSQKYRANPAGDIDAMLLAVADPTPGPSEYLAEQEDAKIAAAVIDALPEESREVLLLYYREGQSTQQVAALLGMQNAAVRKRLSRARQSIREELIERVGEFAKSTSPTMAFTAMVTTSPAMLDASNTAAAAGIIATAATGGSIASKGLAAGFLGAIAGVVVGVLGSLAGIWGGIAHLVIKPFDAQEKRELMLYGTVNSGLLIAFTMSMLFVKNLSMWMLLSMTIALMIGLMLSTTLWLPRILKRRADYDREHPADDVELAEPVGTWNTLSTMYSKKTPRYRLRNTGSGSMHFWMTGVPGEYIAPFDDQEKRELHRFVIVINALFIGLVLNIGLVAYFKSWLDLSVQRGLTLLLTTAFASAIAYSFYIWLPRILSRRRAFEEAQKTHSIHAAPFNKKQRQRVHGFLGILIGIIMGTVGLIAGLLFAGAI